MSESGCQILLVEDDDILAEATSSALESCGFQVTHAPDATRCFEEVQRFEPGLILLDLELPDVPGHEICKKLRQQNFTRTPIVALSGCKDDSAIVRVLECGADDFVSKSQPFQILVAHLRAVLRRGERIKSQPSAAADAKLCWGPIEIDRSAWRVYLDGAAVSFTPTETRLLEAFVSNPGAVFTRSQLIDRLYGAGYAVTHRSIDVHINSVRRGLGTHKNFLETVRGVGYRLSDDTR